MKISDFTFELPPELIAQTPAERRGEDRLLVIDRRTGRYRDTMFRNFPDFVEEGSLLVVNDTRVRKARVYGISETGGKVEFLFTGAVQNAAAGGTGPSNNTDIAKSKAHFNDGASKPEGSAGCACSDIWQAMVSKSRRQKVGKIYSFYDKSGGLYCTGSILSDVEDRDAGSALKLVKFDRNIDEEFFIRCGHVPLPPYIKREDDFTDETRYQTIFADRYGSMAAPTAGLHFTEEILRRLKEKDVEVVHITLEVGMGTFLPVRTENLEDHVMHTEAYHISEVAALAINRAKAQGRKVVASGTTSVRTLESAFDRETGLVKSGSGNTDLFITPGFSFNVVNQLVTNFHTPQSTLLVLVSAFAGRENILKAYRHAVDEHYRFFSYGDATFIM